jgi:hypothetical protein
MGAWRCAPARPVAEVSMRASRRTARRIESLSGVGGLRVVDARGAPIEVASRKRCLPCVARSDAGRLSRERLAGMLWGDRSDEQARANLRQLLYEPRLAWRRARFRSSLSASDTRIAIRAARDGAQRGPAPGLTRCGQIAALARKLDGSPS